MNAYERILLFLFSILTLIVCTYGYIEHPGPRFPATKGELWPKAQEQHFFSQQMSIDLDNFGFQITGKSCNILEKALARYLNILYIQGGKKFKKKKGRPQANAIKGREIHSDSVLTKLTVNLGSECEEWPYLNMNESYELSAGNGMSELKSDSIWGILRGLETFSQLAHKEDPLNNTLYINKTMIYDFPRFSHRGLLLDTSRHFVSLPNIKQILNGMAYNKLNVFHWHIVDDQSFPYESTSYPNLSKMGAYHPKLIYTQKSIQRVLEYARLRGIRVMVEFDSPGHTRSWGVAYPELLTQCYTRGKPDGDLGPIDPTNPFVYSFLTNLFKEISEVFPDRYVHLGGDEVDFDCWQSNPNINEYMKNNKIFDYRGLEEFYIQKVIDIVYGQKLNSVVWQEVYLNGVQLPKGTVVHAWTGNQENLLSNITADGLPALLSSCWYLDHLSTGGDWQKFYKCDAHNFPGSIEQKKLVLGGEACMWSEVVDDSNVLSRIFPRASATAEKLWSAITVNNVKEATYRLEEQYCRMNKRGYPAQAPSGPGYCI